MSTPLLTSRTDEREAATGEGRPSPKRVVLSALAAVAAFALAAGLAESAYFAYVRYQVHRLTHETPDAVWMAPVTNAVIMAAPAAVLVLLALTRRIRSWFPLLVGVLAGLLSVAMLRLVPGLADLARVALAAGIGVRFGFVVRAHEAEFRRLLPRVALGLGAVSLTVGLGLAAQRRLAERRAIADLPAAAPGAPNVLLVVWDAVRARSLSLYGYRHGTTPQLERLARGGVVFDEAISTAPWTLPSHAAIFTGKYPQELAADYFTPLGDAQTTLAEVLAGKGYVTGGFVGNIFYTAAETGLAQGMSHYEDFGHRPGDFALSAALGRWLAYNSVRRILGFVQVPGRKSAATINHDLLGWIDRRPRGRPFFAFLNLYDAHAPYLPPAPYDEMFQPKPLRRRLLHFGSWKDSPSGVRREEAMYDGAIAYLDAEFGQLIEALRARKLLNNTIVVLVADHGEEWGEHPRIFGHGNSLYFPSLHVPLVVLAPGRVPAGRRIEAAVSTRDVAETILDLAQVRDTTLPGESLARLWRGDASPGGEAPLLAEVDYARNVSPYYPVSVGDMRSVFSGGFQLIINGDGSEELYNYRRDPLEQNDLGKRAVAKARGNQRGRRPR